MSKEFWKHYISMFLGAIFALCLPLAIASSYGDINVTSCIPGTGATNEGKAEDAAHTTADTGVAFWGVHKDANDTALNADGDYSPITTNDAGNVKVQLEPSRKKTYVATSPPVARATSATDMFLINGNATNIVKVQKVFANYQTSSYGTNNFYLIKRSTANSGGTSSTITSCPLDSGNGAASSVVLDYTANPTPGATVANVGIVPTLGISTGAGVSAQQITLFDADKYGQAIVLRGTAQGLAINNNGATVAGTSPTVGFTVVWTEEGLYGYLLIFVWRLIYWFRRRFAVCSRMKRL